MTESEKQGKVIDLQEAVERHVRPGMSIHLAAGIGGPSAAVCEIIRRFYRKTPGFTLIQSTVTGHAVNLVHARLVKKLICSVCAHIAVSGRPSRVIQDALEQKEIELENWTLNSLQQRLMAGAMGVPFMPTRSVFGSSIADDNPHSFKSMKDPFRPGATVGLASALVPDLSIVHGCVADSEGNTIMAAPYGEDLWGALAAREGVIVTVEKIVPAEFIRRHAAMVKIPSYMVNAVARAPFGLHPFSMANPGISGMEPYEKDVDFLNVLYEAAASEHALEDWIKEWVLDAGTHERYLDKLGAERLDGLKKQSGRMKSEFSAAPSPGVEPDGIFEPGEMMLIALAREILAGVEARGHKVVLAGA
ncbi:MAG TPA: CoA transferase, partial [Acidobacteriota bacterium]|nr:CoA transferase [Acidobacteriota bacterium]